MVVLYRLLLVGGKALVWTDALCDACIHRGETLKSAPRQFLLNFITRRYNSTMSFLFHY